MASHPSLRDPSSTTRRRHLQNWDDGRLWSSVYWVRIAVLALLACASWAIDAKGVALAVVAVVIPFTFLASFRHRTAGKVGWLLPADQYLAGACALIDPKVAVGVATCQIVGAVNGAIGSDKRTVELSILAGGVVFFAAGIVHDNRTVMVFSPIVTVSAWALSRFVGYIQHRYLTAHHRYEELLDGINAYVVESDSSTGRVLYMNRKARELLGGWQANERDLMSFVHPDDRQTAVQRVQSSRESGRPTSFETRIQRRDGSYVYMEQRLTFSKIAASRRQRNVLIDITARKEAERELHHRATHDALTDLPNRRLFRDRLEQSVARTSRHRRPFAVMVVDLDGFKKVNDELGHEAGDQLLQEASARLAAAVRAVDTVARLGGDEFAILLDETDAVQAIAVAERCVKSLALPATVSAGVTTAKASFGVVIAPEGGETADTLMRHADMAMYQAKRLGTGYHLYNNGMSAASLESVSSN